MMLALIIVAVIIAFIVGTLTGFYIKKDQSSTLKHELDESKKQLLNYQNTVNEHIYKTQQIMESINHQFDALQKHSQEYHVKLKLDASKTPIDHDRKIALEQENTDDTKAPKDYAV